ncbi:hypothetical protein Bca101_070580 [Brassica carinata]
MAANSSSVSVMNHMPLSSLRSVSVPLSDRKLPTFRAFSSTAMADAKYAGMDDVQRRLMFEDDYLVGPVDDSSSSSSRLSLRSPSDYSLSSYFSNGQCNGSSQFTPTTKYDHGLSLCESLLHRLNIREEEEQEFNNYSVPSFSPRRSCLSNHHQGSSGNKIHPRLRDLQGYVYLMAKDQHGCRSLQRVLEDGSSIDAMVIFNEVIPHVVELMINPFGNYLMQKLLDVCNEEQRTTIILIVTSEPGLLVRIALNPHGTRVVQRLVESIKTKKQIYLVTSALRPGFHNLAINVNGNHVIQRCLQCLITQDNKFIFEDATRFCIDIATHQHGCCVLQKCVAYSTGQQREKLITQISRNSLFLAQHPYGNYAVQFIIEMRDFQATAMIVLELISVSRFDLLIQDPYANFVIQAALSVTEASLKST